MNLILRAQVNNAGCFIRGMLRRIVDTSTFTGHELAIVFPDDIQNNPSDKHHLGNLTLIYKRPAENRVATVPKDTGTKHVSR
jgi:hypothetical protein